MTCSLLHSARSVTTRAETSRLSAAVGFGGAVIVQVAVHAIGRHVLLVGHEDDRQLCVVAKKASILVIGKSQGSRLKTHFGPGSAGADIDDLGEQEFRLVGLGIDVFVGREEAGIGDSVDVLLGAASPSRRLGHRRSGDADVVVNIHIHKELE